MPGRGGIYKEHCNKTVTEDINQVPPVEIQWRDGIRYTHYWRRCVQSYCKTLVEDYKR